MAQGPCRWGERASDGCYSRAGSEIWRTDGTAKGTRRVGDLRAGISGSSPGYLTVFDGALFFAAHTDLTGTEMFRSDGTMGGTNIVEVGWSRGEAVHGYTLCTHAVHAFCHETCFFRISFECRQVYTSCWCVGCGVP